MPLLQALSGVEPLELAECNAPGLLGKAKRFGPSWGKILLGLGTVRLESSSEVELLGSDTVCLEPSRLWHLWGRAFCALSPLGLCTSGVQNSMRFKPSQKLSLWGKQNVHGHSGTKQKCLGHSRRGSSGHGHSVLPSSAAMLSPNSQCAVAQHDGVSKSHCVTGRATGCGSECVWHCQL